MRLPKLPNRIRHNQQQTVQFGGLNLTAKAREGEFTACSGLSGVDYPFITQMPARLTLKDYNAPTDIFAWNGDLYVLDGTDFKKNGQTIGTLTAGGNKRFAIVNTKLVIFPDKVYVDMADDSINSLITKDETYSSYTITDSSISATGIDSVFSAGDVLDVTGEGIEGKRIVVESTSSDTLTFASGAISLDTYSGDLSVKTSVPDLDFICSSDNRLWGCSNDDHTVYASALGDPSTFFDYTSDLGSFSSAIGSEGLFTAICEYNGNVLVWKEQKLYKFLGSFPSEYYMVESTIPGVQGGDERSIVVVNGLLYYSGIYGIYVYNGNRPQIVSENLGLGSYIIGSGKMTGISDVCCATDGRLLYVGCMANTAGDEGDAAWPAGAQLFTYDLLNGIWINELDLDAQILSIVSIGRTLYMLHWEASALRQNYISQSGTFIQTQQPWYAEFGQVTENVFDRKGYTKILLRLDMKNGSGARVLAREDNRAYREVWSEEIPAAEHIDYIDEEVTIPEGGTGTFTALADYSDLYQFVYVTVNGVKPFYTIYDYENYILTSAFSEYTMTVDFSASTISITDNYEDGHPEVPGTYAVNVFIEFTSGGVEGSVKTIPIRLGRCDRYQIRLEGHGEVTVRGMAREHVTGSDIN